MLSALNQKLVRHAAVPPLNSFTVARWNRWKIRTTLIEVIDNKK